MIKIFYYDDDTENLLTEDDAEETTLEEAVDELFNLADDDVSYVGFISEKERFKVKSDKYDEYKVYFFTEGKEEYILGEILTFDKLKKLVEDKFAEMEDKQSLANKENNWLPVDWGKN